MSRRCLLGVTCVCTWLTNPEIDGLTGCVDVRTKRVFTYFYCGFRCFDTVKGSVLRRRCKVWTKTRAAIMWVKLFVQSYGLKALVKEEIVVPADVTALFALHVRVAAYPVLLDGDAPVHQWSALIWKPVQKLARCEKRGVGDDSCGCCCWCAFRTQSVLAATPSASAASPGEERGSPGQTGPCGGNTQEGRGQRQSRRWHQIWQAVLAYNQTNLLSRITFFPLKYNFKQSFKICHNLIISRLWNYKQVYWLTWHSSTPILNI